MRIVMKIERKPDADYIINAFGEIFEVKKELKKIGEIEISEDKKYYINTKGEVIEKEVVRLKWDEFFRYKKDGRLAQLFREGKEVEIEDETTPLNKISEYEDEFLKSSLEGAKIEKVEIERKQGNKSLTLTLSNGKKIKLSEGLLTGSSSLEVE